MEKTYKDKLLDPRWQKKRLKILESDNFSCRFCGNDAKTLHVHHFSYNKNGNPWDISDSKLVTLCEDCHSVTHHSFTELESDLIDLLIARSVTKKNTESNMLVRLMNTIILSKKR